MLIEQIRLDLTDHVGDTPQFDDLTMLAVYRNL
jgi:serine phosphatase RsbU (regulator of sigma subunit)